MFLRQHVELLSDSRISICKIPLKAWNSLFAVWSSSVAVYCKKKSTILPFCISDLSSLFWSKSLTPSKEPLPESYQQYGRPILGETKFCSFSNIVFDIKLRCSEHCNVESWVPFFLQRLSVTRALQQLFHISKLRFWWTSIKCIHDKNGERSFRNHYFNVNSQSIRVALIFTWFVLKKKTFEVSFRSSRLRAMKVKSDHRSKFSNLSNWKEEAWKNQGFNGIRTRDLRDTAIPVRCSTNWAMKPHIGSEVNLLSSYLPVQWNDVKFIWNNSYLYCGYRWKWRVIIA